MFCYQCQETVKNEGCTVQGVCGKTEEVAVLQDLLVYATKGLAQVSVKNHKEQETAELIYDNLFRTITNANFDPKNLEDQIFKTLQVRDEIRGGQTDNYHDAAIFNVDRDTLIVKAENIGVLSEANEDIRSLKELITYGLKGLCAYGMHAYNLEQRNFEVEKFVAKALTELLEEKTADELVALVLETGSKGVEAMALLDGANTGRYGHPEMTKVNIGVGTRPGILVSGHDLVDLEMLLEQSKDSGVDIYTHGEMLPAHSYPFFKKYDHLVGNYGGSWWKQISEFKTFNGPILFTTNCIVPRKDGIEKDIFTTGSAAYPESIHINEDENGYKDFSEIIERAKKCQPPTEIETGTVLGGFAHNQILSLVEPIKEALESGDLKKFVVMGGCDGRHKSRNYYEDFAKQLPKDHVILTAGCAKYRYNKLDLGETAGIPRVLDAGQCNDSYSLAYVALQLQKLFELDDINDLPIIYNIAWYEQKAVIVLLALLSLGVKNIHLGPTLPAFLSSNVAKIIVDTFGLSPISTVEEDLKKFSA